MVTPRAASQEKILAVLTALDQFAADSPARPCQSRPVRHLPESLVRELIESLFAAGAAADKSEARAAFATLQRALSAGEVRAAEPDAASPTGWRVNAWVKQGILLGFRFGDLVDMSEGLPFYDKDTMPFKRPGVAALSASSPADRASARAPTWRRPSSACRRCT
jgi:hypothetical protein